jgi:hypothetical protein
MHGTAARLLERAMAAAAVPPELTATDLLALATGAALAGGDAAGARRLVRLMRAGIDAHARGA